MKWETCETCGRKRSVPEDPKAYEYTGAYADWLDVMLGGFRLGASPVEIRESMRRRLHRHGLTWPPIPSTSHIAYIARRYGFNPPLADPYLHARGPAGDEHAMLLRCEGLTYSQIGARLGVSRERSRQRIAKAARKLNGVMHRRHTKFRWETSQ
jgi:hypothetical protein